MTPLPFTVRHGYGIAAFSLAIANTSVMFLLLEFLVDGAGLAAGVAGVVLLVGKAWDAVSDPIVGWLSDRTNTRWGARRPWIAAGALPFALTFALLWTKLPFEGLSLALAYGLLLLIYNTAYTAVVVPFGALTPALTDDYDERTRLNAARMTWSMIGGLVAAIAFPELRDRLSSWFLPGAILALFMIPPLWITVVSTAGRDRPGAADPDAEPIWTVLQDQSFRRVAALFLAAWTAIAVLSAMIPFFVKHHLRAPEQLVLYLAAVQITAMLVIPLVAWFAARTEKHVAYAWLIGSWACVLLVLALVPETGQNLALVLCIAAGPGVAAAHVLPWSMLPDVVEADARKRGRARAGAYYGAMTFLEKSATALALGLLGFGLQAAGYLEGAATQSETTRLAIRLSIGPLPGLVLLGAAVLALWRPPLTRAQHAAARSESAAP